MMVSLALWMNIEKTVLDISATRDREVWNVMVANATNRGT